jgi:hypothetical protein
MSTNVTFIARLFALQEHQRVTSWLFIKLLALIYLSAFLSLAVQIDGLSGPQGIMPFQEQLDGAYEDWGWLAWLWFPVIYWWLEPTDTALVATAYLGALLSLLLLWGRWRVPLLIGLFLAYLSHYHAGQYFTNFQWDTLLLEIGFLAIFLAGGPRIVVILLFEWLLFRLRFMSGVFKLVSGDPSWSGFSALNHYFETQPLPHAGAWFAHHLPDWMLAGGVGLTFFSELVVPFFIFLSRPYRVAAASITIIIQLLIIATSNHNFINLLTILLCLFLLDDRLLGRLVPGFLKQKIPDGKTKPGRAPSVLLLLSGVLIVSASLMSFTANAFRERLPLPLQQFTDSVRRLGVGNIYHVFPTMQLERHELVIEGSHDGLEWKPYQFKYKPQDLDRRPVFNVPHQPRLDWMIWFVPTQRSPQMEWFGRFLDRLHEGSASVTALLAHNPFEERPPNYLRVRVYRYRFTTPSEREADGSWWRREYLGQFPWVAPRQP